MLPYTPLHHLLFDGANFQALVMTSGNSTEEPIATPNAEIAPRLHPLADYILLHNRTYTRAWTIPWCASLKDASGHAALARLMPRIRSTWACRVAEVLACGGELKNVFCLTKEHYAILSQHIGDLENLETMEVFRETLEHMKRFFPRYAHRRSSRSASAISRARVTRWHWRAWRKSACSTTMRISPAAWRKTGSMAR